MSSPKSVWLFFVAACLLCAPLGSCGRSPLPESYTLRFPELPALWVEVLGENRWRLDYYDADGIFRRVETGGGAVEAALLAEWPCAVLAWPYWPEKNLAAGLFYPAGAIFPFDREGSTLTLSWEAGAEAYFYRELDKAQYLAIDTKRKPEWFDWRRFRSFLREKAPEELRMDPWLADWKTIAEKTVRSGFRQSYLRAEPRNAVEIVVPEEGPWIGASPFRPAEFWQEGEEVRLSIASRPEILVCPGGRLSVSKDARLWLSFW